MSTRSVRAGAAAAVVAVLAAAGLFLVGGAVAVPAGAAETEPAAEHEHGAEPEAVDQGHQRFQPAYVGGRVASYEPIFDPVPESAEAIDLYEVEYPAQWWTQLARPLCSYCDHLGDGRNAWDFHDHVFDRLPSRAANRAGAVYWHVIHVAPAYTGDAAHDAAVTAAYAEELPATSGSAVRRLLALRLDDGSPVANPVDTRFVFRGPLTRYPRR